MDKFEYKIHLSEIKDLIKEKEFDEASLIADTIDWRRVKSPQVLCMVSDLYKLVGRLEDSRNIMEMAYERQPGSRSIIFSLCELCVKMGDVGQATLYYQEFNHLFPEDAGRYKLLYKLYVAQEVSLEERIALLEEYQRQEKDEKWMYELAQLYHRAGMERQCVEQCDMICTWFGESKFRAKALALKGQHAHLNAVEQAFAEGRELSSSSPTRVYGMENSGTMPGAARAYQAGPQTLPGQAGYDQNAYAQAGNEQSAYGQGGYDQSAYAQQGYDPSAYAQAGYDQSAYAQAGYDPSAYAQAGYDQSAYAQGGYDQSAYVQQGYDPSAYAQAGYDQSGYDQSVYGQGGYSQEAYAPQSGYEQDSYAGQGYDGSLSAQAAPEQTVYDQSAYAPQIPSFMSDQTMDIQVKTIDDNPYSTINLQSNIEKELAKNLQEVLSSTVGEVLEKFNSGDIPPLGNRAPMVKDISGFGQDRIGTAKNQEAVRSLPKAPSAPPAVSPAQTGEAPREQIQSIPATPGLSRAITQNQRRRRTGQELDSLIAEDGDGQLQLVMPDKQVAEKQITGQLGITDVLQDWERKRLEDQAAYRRSIEDKLRFETGEILAKFAEEPDVRPAPVELSELQAVQEAFNLADRRKQKEEEEMIRVVPEPLKTVSAKPGAEQAGSPPEAEASEEKAPLPQAPSAKAPLAQTPPAKAPLPQAPPAKAPEAPEVTETKAPEPAPQQENQPSLTGDTNTQVIPPHELERLERMAKEIAPPKEEPAVSHASQEEPARGTTTKELEAIAAEFIREEQEDSDLADQESEETEDFDEEVMDSEPEEAPEEERPEKRAPEKPARVAGEKAVSQPRSLTPEEKSLFGTFIQDQKSRNQMVDALEKISMASYTGNVILTGDIEKDNDTLAKNIMRYLSKADGNFSGRMAKVTGEAFNAKDPMKVVEKLSAGELYITGASRMTPETVAKLHKALNRAECALVVVLGDRRKAMEKFLENNPLILETFNARIDLQNLSDKELAKFAKVYAREREYSIDAMGMLALLTKIEDNQRNDHAVSVGEVRNMVDEAIHHANGISPVHFIDIVTQRRYDEEDRIILKERDFARV